jgi:hypothetical protein
MTSIPIIFDERLYFKRFGLGEFAPHQIVDDAIERLKAQILFFKKKFKKVLILSPTKMRDFAIDSIFEGDTTCDFIIGEDILNLQKSTNKPYDLIISFFYLHMMNDIPGHLFLLRQLLSPEGVFLCTLVGDDTFHELGTTLYEMDQESSIGHHMRLHPSIKLKDVAYLLKRAQFSDPVSDMIPYNITFTSMDRFILEMQHNRQQNCFMQKTSQFFTKKDVAMFKKKFPLDISVKILFGCAVSKDGLSLS